MRSAGSYFERALGVFLPLDFTEILAVFTAAGKQRMKVNPAWFDDLPTTQKLNNLRKIGGADDINPFDYSRLRGVFRR
jgi:hypothetical protein